MFTTNGLFTVRHSGKFWSGIWTDMCIEQCLMRPMKSVGGLTHGRGITESTLSKWILGTPYFLKVHEAIEDFLGTPITFNEQHVEIRDSRKKRDQLDIQKFTSWLQEHNPFTKESGELVSLSSGYISDGSVNCDQAYEVGISAMQKMCGKNFGELKLRMKDKVQTQAKPRKVKVRSKEVVVNPQPVSYTHLDVYKRQLVEDSLSFSTVQIGQDSENLRTKRAADSWSPIRTVPRTARTQLNESVVR